MKRRSMWITLGVTLLLLPVAAAAWRIDNWRRDLTSNEASLDREATNPLLHPLEYAGDPNHLAAMIEQFVSDQARWQLVEKRSGDESITLHLTHSTALFGFVDDIHVTITTSDTGSLLTATSKSRVGKGDLGQNPRNLKELMREVHRRIEET